MSTPKMYTWRDADAPVLDGTPGSLIQVLRKCLVEGFGSGAQESTPPGAGWEMQVDDPPNRAAFRSLNTNAAGHWYYIDDTGDYDGGGNQGEGAGIAALLGADTFTGWDVNGYPELSGIFGDDGSPFGAQWFPKSSNTDVRAWIVVADDRTVYFVVDSANSEGNAWDNINGVTNSSWLLERQRKSAFGDYARLDPHTGNPAPSGLVFGDNEAPGTGGTGGSLLGANEEAIPMTSDGIATVPALAQAYYPSGHMNSGSFRSDTFLGPLAFARHYVGERSGAPIKGTFRGLRLPRVNVDQLQGGEYPDHAKLYGELTLGGGLGDVFYFVTRLAVNTSNRGHIPFLFVRSDWDNE